MEINATAVIVHNYKEIEFFQIRIDDNKYIIIKERLLVEREKIVKIIKKFYDDKLIKSVIKPKNKQMQKDLNNLVRAKRTIDKTLDIIKQMFK